MVPFSRGDALVVRQVEGRRLHAAIGVAGREDLVDDDDRRESAELRIAVLRIDRQMVLDVLQLAGELLQLGALGFVLNRDERLERRLVVEELVLVHLVGSDRRLDGALQLHPGDVAVVVVVRQERIGALGEKRLQRRLGRERRRPRAGARRRASARSDTRRCTGPSVKPPLGPRRITVKKPSRALAPPPAATAIHRSSSALRRAFGIEIGAVWLRRRAGDKRLVVIEARPRPFVDQEVVQARAAFGRLVAATRSRSIDSLPAQTWRRKSASMNLRRLHQLRQHVAIGRRQLREVGGDLGRRESRRHALQLYRVGQGISLRGQCRRGRQAQQQ